jgi:hypothetical protein
MRAHVHAAMDVSTPNAKPQSICALNSHVEYGDVSNVRSWHPKSGCSCDESGDIGCPCIRSMERGLQNGVGMRD